MALPVCQLCGEREAAQILTNLETGQSMALCAEDFPSFVLSLAEQLMEAGALELPDMADQLPAEPHSTVDGQTDHLESADSSTAAIPASGDDSNPPDGPSTVRKTASRAPRTTGRSQPESHEASTENVATENSENADDGATADLT